MYVTGAFLGHSQPQTTARYAHLDADPLKQAAEIIGQKVSDVWKQAGDIHTEKPDMPSKVK